MAERKQVDWEGVERDYSAGLLSLRELADKYGVAHVTIKKKADRLNWARNLGAKINAEAERRANTATANSDANSKKAITEKEIINANAQVIVDIKLSHRKDIVRVKKTVNTLLDEIEELSKSKSADNLPVRVDMTKKLMDTLKVAIDKERQAFGIQDKTAEQKPTQQMTDEEIERRISDIYSKS